MAATKITALLLRSEAQPRVTNLILRSKAVLCVSKDAPERFAQSAHAGAPLEAPLGRLRTREGIGNYKGNAVAAFPTVPHSHSGPNVMQIRLAGQGATQGVG